MNIAYIDTENASISITNKTLHVESRKVPLKLIDTLVITAKCAIDSRTLLKLTKENIVVVFLHPKTYEMAMTFTGSATHADLKAAQYASLSKRVDIAKYFLINKFSNHSEHLKAHKLDINLDEYLRKIKQAESIESLLGFEGTFSREYFSHYFSLLPKKYHLGKRSKRPPLDPVNATLSYMYSMLYNFVSAKLLMNGFELGIAYLHTPFRSHNALASDFMEMYRHVINQAVMVLFEDNVLTHDHFYKKDGVYLKYDGRHLLYSHINALFQGLEPSLATHIANIKSML